MILRFALAILALTAPSNAAAQETDVYLDVPVSEIAADAPKHYAWPGSPGATTMAPYAVMERGQAIFFRPALNGDQWEQSRFSSG